MRKHNYVVGFSEDGQAVHGQQLRKATLERILAFTAKDAMDYKKFLNNSLSRPDARIFKLVEVKGWD